MVMEFTFALEFTFSSQMLRTGTEHIIVPSLSAGILKLPRRPYTCFTPFIPRSVSANALLIDKINQDRKAQKWIMLRANEPVIKSSVFCRSCMVDAVSCLF